MNRGYNFGAGPAMLPVELLTEVQNELLNWQNSGMSVMEIGHRTKEFMGLMSESVQLVKHLLNIPDHYHVLLLGGAARQHFGMIPLNFSDEEKQAGYLITGLWSSLAFQEARRLKKAYCVASNESSPILLLPQQKDWLYEDQTSYLYYTPNETINGVRCVTPPKMAKVPLIADMTSCLLSEPININDYALIFAGAQKNIANAGLTLVIVREDLLKSIKETSIPTMLDYRVHAQHQSLYATPPTFNCYIAWKMFKWIEKQGGVERLYEKNLKKAHKLYDFIDSSSFYHCKIAVESRSIMNICFTLSDRSQEEHFIAAAEKEGLLALKGHKTMGGVRASLYNSMPMEGVELLISFMENFALRYAV